LVKDGHTLRVAGKKQFDEEAVLDALVQTFWTHGYEATSIEDLERAAGLRRQSLYGAFGPKEAMYARAMERYLTTAGGPIRAAIERDDPREGIRGFIDAHLARMADPSCPGGCFHAAACTEHAPGSVLGDRTAADVGAAEAWLTAVLERWRAEGRLRTDRNPRPLALYLIAFVRGLAVMHRATGNLDAVREAADAGMAAVDPWLQRI
jgi:TetR/AcrR family transcriptional repressor of nem operon